MINVVKKDKNIKKEKIITDNYEGGFTLIEYLIYIVIVSLIMGALFFTLINIMIGRTRIGGVNQANYNGRRIMKTIETYFNGAENVNYPDVGQSGDYLSLEMTDEDISPVVFEVDDDGRFTIKRGDNDPTAITSRLVSISDEDIFYNISHDEGPATVRTVINLEYRNPIGGEDNDFETTFYSTFNLMKEGLAAGNGEDPEEDCATFEVGDFCGGGHIFYIDDAEEFSWDALIAAPESTEFINKHWGYQGVDIEDEGYPDIRLDGLGDGENASQAWLDYHNSLDPEDQREDKAFLHCEDLVYEDGEQTFDDWFLPTEGELFEMYESLENRATPVGDFCSTDCDYLSSTEYSANNVRAVWFDDGSSSLYNKDYYSDSWPMKIRCVRKWYE